MLIFFPGADPGFWSGWPSRVLTPEGVPNLLKIRVFSLKLLENCIILTKNLGARGGLGPQGLLDPLVISLLMSKTSDVGERWESWTKCSERSPKEKPLFPPPNAADVWLHFNSLQLNVMGKYLFPVLWVCPPAQQVSLSAPWSLLGQPRFTLPPGSMHHWQNQT